MVDSKKKTNIILWSIAAGLVVLFFLSFTKTASSDKRKPVKTALLNPKNLNLIDCFEISCNETKVIIQNRGDFWIITDGNNEIVAAERSKIEKLKNELSKTRVLYKVSDSINNKSDFGLSDQGTFHLKYKVNDSFTDLIFGKSDFSETSRYFVSGRSATVYEIDTELDKFLSVNIQSWAEPYLISRQVLGNIKKTDVQNLWVEIKGKSLRLMPENAGYDEYVSRVLELRHGGAASKAEIDSKAGEIELELGDKSKITIKIFNSKIENEYICDIFYKNSINSKNTSCMTKISGWTFNKLVM